MTESTLFFTCFSLPGFATMPVSVLCNHLWASCAYFLMAPPFAPFLTALFGVAAPFLTALFGVALDAGLGLLLRVPRVFTIAAGLERERVCGAEAPVSEGGARREIVFLVSLAFLESAGERGKVDERTGTGGMDGATRTLPLHYKHSTTPQRHAASRLGL